MRSLDRTVHGRAWQALSDEELFSLEDCVAEWSDLRVAALPGVVTVAMVNNPMVNARLASAAKLMKVSPRR
jgi:hypothetical protein